MKKEDVKKAVQLAEKELKEKQIEQVKEFVKRTLEKINVLDEKIAEYQEKRKILKLDIDDLKAGRLDRIEERQSKDEKAKKVSVAEIVKVVEHHHHHYNDWYYPYRIVWQEPFHTYPITGITYCNTGSNISISHGEAIGSSIGNLSNTSSSSSSGSTINCSIAKDYSAGTYNIDGDIVHLR